MLAPTTPESTILRSAFVARAVIAIALLVEAALMWNVYGGDQRGLDGMMIWMCCWIVLPAFVAVVLPAWLLMPQLAAGAEPDEHRCNLRIATWPVVAALVIGTGFVFGDWEKLWFVLIPTVPTLCAVAFVARRS